MFRHLTMVGVVAAGLATAGWASGPASAPGAGWLKGPAANTPLGRLVTASLGRLLVLRSELELTAEQRRQIRDVLVGHRAQIAQTVKSVRDKRVVLRDAVLQGQSDEQIRAAAAELGTQIAEASVKAAKLRNQLAPILTEQQRKRIGQFIADQDQAVGRFLEQAGQ